MTDPICDMNVEPDSAAGKVDYDGQTYYFCSAHCQKLFQTDPAKYLAAAAARKGAQAKPQDSSHHQHHHDLTTKPETSGAIYTCPMDPEVRQKGAGACPKCGMALEPLDNVRR